MSTAAPRLRLATVMLGVRDMDRSLAFYRDTLGLPLRFPSSEFSFLDAGEVTLVLRLAPDLEGAADERWSELVLHVDDIDEAHRALAARGVAFRVAPRVVNGADYAADFRDPDGHVLSIFGLRRSGA